jgi:phosphatidate cytidylyltransferase
VSLERFSGEAWALLLIFGALLIGTVIRGVARLRSEDEHARERMASLLTWWVLAVLFAGAILLGALGVCALLAAASLLGFREFARLAAVRPADRLAARAVLVAIPALYLAILLGAGPRAIAALPVVALLLVIAAQLSRSRTEGYIRSTGGLLFGVLTVVFGLAHGALLATLPGAAAVPGSDVDGVALEQGASWFLYLVLLTQINDIAQALVGRRIGKHKITPRISPHKTWEGFAGGGVVTVLVARRAGAAAHPARPAARGARRPGGVRRRLPGRHQHVGGQARRRSQGLEHAAARNGRHARPGRQPDPDRARVLLAGRGAAVVTRVSGPSRSQRRGGRRR